MCPSSTVRYAEAVARLEMPLNVGAHEAFGESRHGGFRLGRLS